MDASLIAPCGMNCALCMAYQRVKRHCDGCRSDNIPFEYCRQCAIRSCVRLAEKGWSDCSRCEKHCARIKQLDKRYRTKYGMSMLENLSYIRDNGMDAFLASQRERFACGTCAELICVHYGKCLKCSPK